MDRNFEENEIDTVMHFAGYISVPESIKKPDKYYLNNTYSTLCLLKSMKKNNIKNIIFSSTAAVYGNIENKGRIDEEYKISPINPYGKSKYMAEEIIKDMAQNNDVNYVIFRYFNVAGADKDLKSGQNNKNITALIPNILKCLNDKKKELYIFGNDYNTKDGTCIRDYVYITDLVKAHILAINFLNENKNEIFNLGSEKGFSILEIIHTLESISNKKINYIFKNRRNGDPEEVTASSKKAKKMLGWKNSTNIRNILETAFYWEKLKKI